MQPYDEARIESIVGMVTGPISIISSLAIIVMLSRTKNRFSTTNHRLLLALSITDVIASIAMSFVSIPAPADMKDQWIALGNTVTCEIQGVFFFIGAIATPCYNAGICLHYLLKIRYSFTDSTIKKRVEPILLLLPPILSASFGIYALVKNYFNPSLGCPCFLGDFPEDCSSSPEVDCERGENVFDDVAIILTFVLIFLVVPLTILLSMAHIYVTVRRMESRMRRWDTTTDAAATATYTYSRQALYRGISYSSAWFLSFFFPMVMFYQEIFSESGKTGFTIRVLTAIFHPLQGFFNFVVYISPKLRQQRKERPGQSFCETFTAVLFYKYSSSPSYDGDDRNNYPRTSDLISNTNTPSTGRTTNSSRSSTTTKELPSHHENSNSNDR